MALTQCPECGGQVSTTAEACPHCGAKAPAAPTVVVHHDAAKDSPVFAAITLAFWLVAAPVGFVLNLVGLFTGPRRGCFAAMLVVFLGLPVLTILLVLLLGGGSSVLEDAWRQLQELIETAPIAPSPPTGG